MISTKRIGKRTGKLPVWLLVAAVVATVGLAVTSQAQDNAQNPPGNAAGQVQPQADGEQPATKQKMSFLELLGKGEWFMVPIALCSLIGLAVIFERVLALRTKQIIPPTFLPGLKAALGDQRNNRKAGMDYCHANPCPAARVVAVGIRKLPQGEEVVEQAIEDAGANEVFKLRKNLRLLYGVSSVAPMIGLLGTVWGMIEAFQEASIHGLGADELAGGIYEALVTTFAGLCVAIPVLVFYFYFLGKIEEIVSRMNDICEDFVEHVMVMDPPSSTPTPPSSSPAPTTDGPPMGATPQPA